MRKAGTVNEDPNKHCTANISMAYPLIELQGVHHQVPYTTKTIFGRGSNIQQRAHGKRAISYTTI